MRTCIGCRTKGGAGTLVRLVLGQDGRLFIDRNAPGRGAWLCRQGTTELARSECVETAGKRHAFDRALRGEVGAGQVEALFAMACEHARIEQTAVVPATGTPGQH